MGISDTSIRLVNWWIAGGTVIGKEDAYVEVFAEGAVFPIRGWGWGKEMSNFWWE